MFFEGRVDSAVKESARAVELDSTLLATVNLVSMVNLAAGHPEVARRLIAIGFPVLAMSNGPYIYARLGDTATAMRLVRAIEANNPRPWFADVARASTMLALGDTANALAGLERSDSATGGLWTVYLPVCDPAYDAIRHTPRFAALVRKAGLDTKVITAPRAVRAF